MAPDSMEIPIARATQGALKDFKQIALWTYDQPPAFPQITTIAEGLARSGAREPPPVSVRESKIEMYISASEAASVLLVRDS